MATDLVEPIRRLRQLERRARETFVLGETLRSEEQVHVAQANEALRHFNAVVDHYTRGRKLDVNAGGEPCETFGDKKPIVQAEHPQLYVAARPVAAARQRVAATKRELAALTPRFAYRQLADACKEALVQRDWRPLDPDPIEPEAA